MSQQVSTSPALPQPPSYPEPDRLLDYEMVLNNQVQMYLSDLGRRANESLPSDGSEPMTGDLDLDGFSLLNVEDITADDGVFDNLTSTVSTTLKGTATNDNAAAGNIGEYISASLDDGSPNGLVTATPETIVSISLTAGDWDVVGNVGFSAGATTSWTFITQSISLVNNTADTTNGRYAAMIFPGGQVMGSGPGRMVFASLACRLSLASTTTVYLVAQANFTISTQAAYGQIAARRVR